MLHDVLKNVLFASYKPQDMVNFFVSLYDEKDVLLASQWLLSNTKPLAESLDLMMRGVLQQYEAKTHMVVVDIATDIEEEPDITIPVFLSTQVSFGFLRRSYIICLS